MRKLLFFTFMLAFACKPPTERIWFDAAPCDVQAAQKIEQYITAYNTWDQNGKRYQDVTWGDIELLEYDGPRIAQSRKIVTVTADRVYVDTQAATERTDDWMQDVRRLSAAVGVPTKDHDVAFVFADDVKASDVVKFLAYAEQSFGSYGFAFQAPAYPSVPQDVAKKYDFLKPKTGGNSRLLGDLDQEPKPMAVTCPSFDDFAVTMTKTRPNERSKLTPQTGNIWVQCDCSYDVNRVILSQIWNIGPLLTLAPAKPLQIPESASATWGEIVRQVVE